MGNMKHFKGFSIQKGDIKVKVSLDRFSHQYREAQRELDIAVMNSMLPFMPYEAGVFKDRTKQISESLEGTGRVCAAAEPMGRFLYEGKVMVDSKTKNGPRKIPTGPGEFVFRFQEGAKLVATDRDLTYSNPNATSHWFDTAKKKDGDDWVKQVKKTAGGG